MADLNPQTPLSDQKFPIGIGDLTIAAPVPGAIVSIMPYAGQAEALSARLKDQLGVPLPDPGHVHTGQDVEIIWTGLNQWFLCGTADLNLKDLASLTDQSDGWAVLALRGAGAREVMARLCPLDLRHFEPGQVARSEFAHMMSIILPRESGSENAAYDIWVMRSFAQTALHHLKEAALGFEAIKALRS